MILSAVYFMRLRDFHRRPLPIARPLLARGRSIRTYPTALYTHLDVLAPLIPLAVSQPIFLRKVMSVSLRE